MKYLISCYIAKLIYFVSRILKIGSGFTAPGHYILKVFPDILNSKQIKFKDGVVLVSGTNGKTTTTKLITHLLENSFNVITNASGSNLLRGIVSSVLLATDWMGNLKGSLGVFEVDELHLLKALHFFKPKVIVLTNLSRDQLDRYWEIENIFDKWYTALKEITYSCKILCDISQPEFKKLTQLTNVSVEFFTSSDEYLCRTKLKGTYNCKNVNAGVAVAKYFGISEDILDSKLQNFNYAYGRGEVLNKFNKEFKIMLTKNPASYNHNLQALENDGNFDAAVLILNDNIPDGRDVSWIYDIDTKLFNSVFSGKNIYICGTRYLEMALRCRYAYVNFDEKNIGKSLSSIINKVSQNNNNKNVLVLPNYSAMLEVRKLLKGSKIL